MAPKRDAQGRWLAGGGSPNEEGRVKKTELDAIAAAREAVFAILREEVTADDWRAIVAKQVTQAKAGSWRSVSWLSSYVLGAPPEIGAGNKQQVLVSINWGGSDENEQL